MVKESLNIGFLIPGRGRTGGTRVTVTLANRLIDRGHNVKIYYIKNFSSLRSLMKLAWHKIVFPGTHDWLHDFKGKIYPCNEISECQFDGTDILIGVGMTVSSKMNQLISLRIPMLQYIHGLAPWQPEIMEQALNSPIPKIVIATYLQPIVRSYGCRVLGIISNGIDQRDYYESLDSDEKDGVGTIYETHPSKDPKTILAVLKLLSRKNPHTPIRIFGRAKRPKGIRLASYKRYPSIAKAREIYSKSQVWLVMSKYEGFSVPILEAMACGSVVVATDCGGTKDIIENGKNGFLVDVGNINQIVEKTQLLLTNHELRNKLRKSGFETVKRFTWEKSINKLENVVNQILSENKRNS